MSIRDLRKRMILMVSKVKGLKVSDKIRSKMNSAKKVINILLTIQILRLKNGARASSCDGIDMPIYEIKLLFQ